MKSDCFAFDEKMNRQRVIDKNRYGIQGIIVTKKELTIC